VVVALPFGVGVWGLWLYSVLLFWWVHSGGVVGWLVVGCGRLVECVVGCGRLVVWLGVLLVGCVGWLGALVGCVWLWLVDLFDVGGKG